MTAALLAAGCSGSRDREFDFTWDDAVPAEFDFATDDPITRGMVPARAVLAARETGTFTFTVPVDGRLFLHDERFGVQFSQRFAAGETLTLEPDAAGARWVSTKSGGGSTGRYSVNASRASTRPVLSRRIYFLADETRNPSRRSRD